MKRCYMCGHRAHDVSKMKLGIGDWEGTTIQWYQCSNEAECTERRRRRRLRLILTEVPAEKGSS